MDTSASKEVGRDTARYIFVPTVWIISFVGIQQCWLAILLSRYWFYTPILFSWRLANRLSFAKIPFEVTLLGPVIPTCHLFLMSTGSVVDANLLFLSRPYQMMHLMSSSAWPHLMPKPRVDSVGPWEVMLSFCSWKYQSHSMHWMPVNCNTYYFVTG